MHKFENLAGEDVKDLTSTVAPPVSTPVKKRRKRKPVKKELSYETTETDVSPVYPVSYQGIITMH